MTSKYKHTSHPLYKVWNKMKERCTKKYEPAYKNYGARGIKVCAEWELFENFVTDMGTTYKKGLTLDRINNGGNYEPTNCRWATRKEQNNNTRRNKIFTFNGKSKNLTDWSKDLKVNYSLLSQRYYAYGWTIEKTLSTPRRNYNK